MPKTQDIATIICGLIISVLCAFFGFALLAGTLNDLSGENLVGLLLFIGGGAFSAFWLLRPVVQRHRKVENLKSIGFYYPVYYNYSNIGELAQIMNQNPADPLSAQDSLSQLNPPVECRASFL